MNQAITTTVVLTLLRYLITLAGGAVFWTKHDSEFTNLAGLLAAAIPALIGAWSDYKNHKQQQALKVDLAVAKEETAVAQMQTDIIVKEAVKQIEEIKKTQ